jgi:hypothetical protein
MNTARADDRGRRPPRSPDPARLATVLVTAWLEVHAGRRPLAQLLPLVAPALGRRLAAQLCAVPRTRPGARVRVLRVRGGQPHPRAFEAAVVVTDDDRVTAIAVRLERHLGAWRGVELTAPETGLPALRTASLRVAPTRPDAFDEVLGEDAHELDVVRIPPAPNPG